MHMTEGRVRNALVPFLNRLGYHMTKVRGRGQPGVDIKARNAKFARYFEIEVKGEPGRAAKSQQSGREVRFLAGLGQILTRIRPEREYLYAIAYPASYKAMVCRRVAPTTMKCLRLSFFFVSSNGHVEHVTWREMARLEAAA